MNRNKRVARMALDLQHFASAPIRAVSLYDYVVAPAVTAYWEESAEDQTAYLGAELWPESQKLGLKLGWVKGAAGTSVVLKPSAYDAVAPKRGRVGFQSLEAHMPFFKEAMYINEELRQMLNMALETGNQSYINTIIRNIFDDEIRLLKAAAAQRERMRMMALTTGYISIAANGQNYDYDYAVPDTHRVEPEKSWSDPTSDIVSDIRDWQDLAEADTGVRPTRAVCSRKTFGYLRSNKLIRQAVLGSDATAPVSDVKISDYLADELELEIVPYSLKYKDEAGNVTAFVADDVFTLFPSGPLGTGWFGTTPEQSDLMSGNAANVSITDVGVAVTTSQKVDPVNIETKVSMIYLPSYEQADKTIIASVIKTPTDDGDDSENSGGGTE